MVRADPKWQLDRSQECAFDSLVAVPDDVVAAFRIGVGAANGQHIVFDDQFDVLLGQARKLCGQYDAVLAGPEVDGRVGPFPVPSAPWQTAQLPKNEARPISCAADALGMASTIAAAMKIDFVLLIIAFLLCGLID